MSSSVTAALSWLQQTQPSTLVRQSSWAVMALESAHLVGLALLGGAAVIVGLASLRAGGLGGLSVPTLVVGLRPVRRAGLALMALSGVMIAASMPFKYYGNAAFRWKMLLLVVVLLASWVLQRLSGDSVKANTRSAARILAFAVLLLWIAVGCCGRLIGFL
jgi:hypothetical protein